MIDNRLCEIFTCEQMNLFDRLMRKLPDTDSRYDLVEGADGAHVAQNNFGGNDRETELANARLIAVAPELCEAAIEVLERKCDICRIRRSLLADCNGCPFQRLSAAVEKVKGGAV